MTNYFNENKMLPEFKKFLASSPEAGSTQHAFCSSVAASLHFHPHRLLFPQILQPPQFHRNHPIHPLLYYYTHLLNLDI